MVLELFLNGFAPETIAQDYPELSLEKIYAAITYYFHKSAEVEAYLQRLGQWRQQPYEQALQKPSPMAERISIFRGQRSVSESLIYHW